MTVLATGLKVGKDKDGAINVVRLKSLLKPMNAFSYAWLWLRLLIAALRLPRTDLVVTLTDPPMLAVAGQIVRKFKKNRHINWCHDIYPDLFPALGIKMPNFIYNALKKYSQQAMMNADKIIVVGRCMAKNLTARGIDPKQISFIPNWPDFELVRPPKDDEEILTTDVEGTKPFEAQIKEGPKFRVLYAGNIGRAHPVDPIIEAAALLDETHPEIEFVFVGDGPRFDYIARQRTQRGLNNIRFMPFQPQRKLREVMESGDIHLTSVKNDAAGLLVPCKIYSALAVGRPCVYIGPAHTEMAKVINDFHAGAVVKPGNAEALAAAILSYRNDSALWFSAHEGALAAGNVFVPKEAIEAWVQRAWNVVEPDIKAEAANDVRAA